MIKLFFSLIFCFYILSLSLIKHVECDPTPACDPSPFDGDYNGYFEYSNIVIIDPSVTGLNNSWILNSIYSSTYQAQNISGQNLWGVEQNEQLWFSDLQDEFTSLIGQWEIAITYDTQNYIPIPIQSNQNINTFTVLSNVLINNTSLPNDLYPLLSHAACQFDMMNGSPMLNNFLNITSDPDNPATAPFIFYSGNLWIVSQDESGTINGYFLTLFMQTSTYVCPMSMPWISCYHQQGVPQETLYWVQAGRAILRSDKFQPGPAQKIIDSDPNYNKHWGKFWTRQS